MGQIRLVARADDAGLNHTVNKAIHAAARQGIVRNISLMAPAPQIRDAAQVLGDLEGTVDFGLHVCLTAEWQNVRWGPVLPRQDVPSLVLDDGTLPSTVRELEGQSLSIEEVMAEVRAQYEALTELGFRLGYVDDHMLAAAGIGAADALAAFADEKGLVYDGRLRQDGTLARLPGWEGPGEHPGTELADQLATTPPGLYLLVGHPGFKTDEMERLVHAGLSRGEVLSQRNRERRMFADIEIVDYCDKAEIELMRYSQLA